MNENYNYNKMHNIKQAKKYYLTQGDMEYFQECVKLLNILIAKIK